GRDFPRRNRIVAGLALGTLVIEAARRSGSLITARFAADYGREVFAVPGSPLDPRAEGTNGLLRDGATLCTRADDIIQALAPLQRERSAPAPRLYDDGRERQSDAEPLWDEWDDLIASSVPSTLAGAETDDPRSAPLMAVEPASPHKPLDKRQDRRAQIIDLLGPAPIAVDEVIRAAEASVAQVTEVLLELELAGRLERHGGNLVSLIADIDH
ncbi:MAG TPA: DNA-processing protein DprA, partial [Beijerinckiaceae bacterium]|nr:DNA-processing protein DprA [Beijerinckiaceae bacterium]